MWTQIFNQVGVDIEQATFWANTRAQAWWFEQRQGDSEIWRSRAQACTTPLVAFTPDGMCQFSLVISGPILGLSDGERKEQDAWNPCSE